MSGFGTELTSIDVRLESAYRAEADIAATTTGHFFTGKQGQSGLGLEAYLAAS